MFVKQFEKTICLKITLLIFLLAAAGGCSYLKEPPVILTSRDSYIGAGTVVRLTNASDEYLHAVNVTVKGPSGMVKTYFRETIRPHQTIEFGWRELDGWEVPSGSEVSIQCKGYGGTVTGIVGKKASTD